MNLYPKPRLLDFSEDFHTIEKINFINDHKFSQRLLFHIEKFKKKFITDYTGDEINITIEYKSIVNKGYEIKKNDNDIVLFASDDNGIYYSLLTLNQMLQSMKSEKTYVLPKMIHVMDYPSFANRGFMLDISRDRVPNLRTIYNLIEILSKIKINELQLYTEHTFRYTKYPEVSMGSSGYDAKDIKKIEEYCVLYFIEIVPNQQTLGHMSKWTSIYPELAEDPKQKVKETFDMDGDPGFSLAANNKNVYKLMDNVIGELSDTFISENINIGLDETWDMCSVSTKADCEQYGKMAVYMNYLNRINDFANKHGFKKIQFWADMIQKETVTWLKKNIPKNTIPMLWGYDEDSTYIREHIHKFSELEIPYYICPSTNSWNSFTGRYIACLNNIHESITLGVKHKATGCLITDWGDNGHTNSLIFSYFGIVCGASMAWNHQYSLDELKLNSLEYLDKYVFGMDISDILWELGTACNYNDMYLPGLSILFHILIFEGDGPMYVLGIEPKVFIDIKKIINSQIRKIEKFRDSRIIKDIKLGCNFLLIAADIGYLLTSMGTFIIRDIDIEVKKNIIRRLKKILGNYKVVWNSNSRIGGFTSSMKRFKNLIEQLS